MTMLDTDVTQMLEQCRGLMERAPDVYLTSIDADGFPQTRCMFNLRCRSRFPGVQPVYAGHDRDLMAYFGTNTSSLKFRQIQANPRVSAYYCEPQAFRGMMLSGMMEIIDDMAIKRAIWQPGWEVYYPQGPADPDFAMLRLLPTRAKGWWDSRPFDFPLRSVS